MFDFIAVAFGIPPSLLKGDTVDTKDAVNNFITFCINPLARLITDEINRKMYGYELYKERTYAKLDTSNIKAVDLRDVANSIDLLNRNAALTIDDILRILGKEPIGGDIGSMRFITKNYEVLDKVLEEGSISNYQGGGDDGGDRINNGNDGNMIISDTTIRTLIVKGIDEVKRIKQVNRDEHIFKVGKIAKDVYEIKLIYRVGDYMKGR